MGSDGGRCNVMSIDLSFLTLGMEVGVRLISAMAGIVISMSVASSLAHADVRICTPDDIRSADDGYGAPDAYGHRTYHRNINELHPRFRLDMIVYNRPPPGMINPDLRLVLKADGYVECMESSSRQSLMLTPQRRALLRDIKKWRFDPVRVAGKPVRALIEWSVPEKIIFHFHEDMPKALLADMSVTLERSLDWPAPSKDKLTIHGDGRVNYEASGLFSDAHGPHNWRISPTEAAALFEKLRVLDVWSAAGNWRHLVTDTTTSTMTLTVGQQSRVIDDLDGQVIGMPATVTEAEGDIEAVADDLIHLTPRGMTILDNEGFDFSSQLGADLLARVSADKTTTEDTALALLNRGAPPDSGRIDSVALSHGHDFSRFVQIRKWPRVITWLKEHGYGPQLGIYKPDFPGYYLNPALHNAPPPQEPFGPATYRQPWMKNARKWY